MIIQVGRKGVNWMSHPEWNEVVGCCQHGNERLTFAKGRKFLTSQATIPCPTNAANTA